MHALNMHLEIKVFEDEVLKSTKLGRVRMYTQNKDMKLPNSLKFSLEIM